MPALGESVTEGTITRWLKQEGERVELDEPLWEVSTDKVDTEIPSPVSGTLLEITVGEDETVEVGAELAVIGTGVAGQYVTPLVRRLAVEHGVDLATLRGTGAGGRIRKQDVLAAAERRAKLR
jgi:2-oxoglutarate dehydrogenase E2 component (dihydrolipoamide succinyltransferase)